MWQNWIQYDCQYQLQQLGGNTNGRPKIIGRKHPCLSGQPDSGRKKHIHHGKVSPGCLCFFRFAGEKPVTKELVMDDKKALVGAGESWSHSFCVYLESDLRNKKEKDYA